jgi:flagellar basal-body rod protein FlgB
LVIPRAEKEKCKKGYCNMSDLFIFDKTYSVLGKALDISERRNRLITSNIANMDTIGYKPKDIDFKKTLNLEMEKQTGGLSRTHRKHFKNDIASGKCGNVRERQGGEYDLDSVNIDTEMTKLTENNIMYRTTVEMLLRKMTILKHAITEGGR